MTREELLTETSRELADQGKLIEAGWVSMQLAMVPPDAPDVQVAEMRKAFMAGAQHLFSSIMAILDPGDDEPSEADLRRMDLISDELNAFYEEMTREARLKAGLER